MSSNVARQHIRPDASAIRLAKTQGLYYLVTGVLPLVSMRTFEAITGPKMDKWQVKTAGLLIDTSGDGTSGSGTSGTSSSGTSSSGTSGGGTSNGGGSPR